MTSAHASEKELKRIPELDGIRGLAILLVLIFHYPVQNLQVAAGSWAAYAIKLLSSAWSGVDLFFVLSGFLIGGILLDHRKSANYFSVFYLRRMCRIFPLYYFFLGLFALFVALKLVERIPALDWTLGDPLPLWSYFAYLQNFVMADVGNFGAVIGGITWSLAVEEQFYLLLPLFIRFCPAAMIPGALVFLICTAPVIRTVLYFSHPHAGLPGYVLLPGRWDSLLIGALAAWGVRRQGFRAWFHSRQRMITVACVVLGLGFAFFPVFKIDQFTLAMSAFGHTWIALFYVLLILLAVYSDSKLLRRAFRNPALVWLGAISYGVYLYHQVVKGFCYAVLLNQHPNMGNSVELLVGALALALTLGISYASWRLFETPIINYGHRVKYHRG